MCLEQLCATVQLGANNTMTDEELRLLKSFTPEQLFQLVDLVNKTYLLFQNHAVQDASDFGRKLIELLSEDNRFWRGSRLIDESRIGKIDQGD